MSGAFDLIGRRVYVAGHRGMVGSALVRRLARESCTVLTATRAEVDLREQAAVDAWFVRERPEVVLLAAARVGGILANDSFPADFIYENLAIELNVIEAARRYGARKLLFLGSSCIYPKFADQPLREEALLTGPLEPTNEWYAIAKIAGIKLCQAYRRQYGCDFITVMPPNLYGPGDNFDPASSHVMAALIRKAHEAKMANAPGMVLWGTGTPRREFLHVDDLADACIHLLNNYSDAMPINVGSGEDLPIADLAALVCEAVGFAGAIEHDLSKPDGTPRKLLDASRIAALGWAPRIHLSAGIIDTYASFLQSECKEAKLGS